MTENNMEISPAVPLEDLMDIAIELKNIDGVFLSNNICTVQNEPVIIKNCTNITISEE